MAGLGRVLLPFIASAVVLIQSVILPEKPGGHDEFHTWAIICSAISFSLCGTVYLVQQLAPEKYIGAQGMKYIAVFLTCLWVGGTGCMTVKRPYPVPGNGYFGAWAALLGSALLLLEFIPQARAPFDRLVADGAGCLAVVILASATVLVQTVYLWTYVADFVDMGVDMGWQWNAAAVWTMVCSGASLLFCTIIVLVGPVNAAARPHWKAITLAFFVWWAIGTGVATFIDPYTSTSNGYFGCWAALIATTVLAARAWEMTGGFGDMIQHASLVAGNPPPEFVVISIASVVTLIASAIVMKDTTPTLGSMGGMAGMGGPAPTPGGYDAWAVACSAISVTTCLVVFVCKAGLWNTPSFDGSVPMISAFLLLVWIAGTGCMTLQAPFRQTGNGYFGAWVALIASWVLTSRSFPVLKQGLQTISSHGVEVAVLLVASATLLLQASVDCGEGAFPCTDHWAWAVACGAVSFVVCIVIVASFEKIKSAFSWIALALFVWWVLAVGLLTFSKPYTTASNAYFACWAGGLASLAVVCKEFPCLLGVVSSVTEAAHSVADATVGKHIEEGNPAAVKQIDGSIETGNQNPAAVIMGAAAEAGAKQEH